MSAFDHATGLTDNGAGRAPPRVLVRRFSKELPLRVLVGSLLALTAVSVTLAGGYFFAGFVALAAVAASREWHRMVGPANYGREWTVTSFAIIAALVVGTLTSNVALPLAVLAGGVLFAAASGWAGKGAPAVWSGLGALYVGIPAWSLVALRTHVPHAQWIVLGMFLTVWTADSGALLVGQAVGGPKLVPSLSPNKTWSGLIGGVILPALAAAGYGAVCGGSPTRSAMVGLALAAAAHSGDLFESWVKRRMGRKNSGGLIPGHGGVLDRIDSTLFVAPAAAVLVYLFGAAQLFGVPT